MAARSASVMPVHSMSSGNHSPEMPTRSRTVHRIVFGRIDNRAREFEHRDEQDACTPTDARRAGFLHKSHHARPGRRALRTGHRSPHVRSERIDLHACRAACLQSAVAPRPPLRSVATRVTIETGGTCQLEARFAEADIARGWAADARASQFSPVSNHYPAAARSAKSSPSEISSAASRPLIPAKNVPKRRDPTKRS